MITVGRQGLPRGGVTEVRSRCSVLRAMRTVDVGCRDRDVDASCTKAADPETDGRRTAAAARRRKREAEIIAATRALFDQKRRPGRADRPDRAGGRGQPGDRLPALHRQGGALRAHPGRVPRRAAGGADRGRRGRADAADRLTRITAAFVDYGVAHPAFVDCAQTLMRRTGPELLEEMSESAVFRLGRAISTCLAVLESALEAGVEAGDFTVEDPTLLANMLYASGLGALQLARVGILVKESAPGVPDRRPDLARAGPRLPRRQRPRSRHPR